MTARTNRFARIACLLATVALSASLASACSDRGGAGGTDTTTEDHLTQPGLRVEKDGQAIALGLLLYNNSDDFYAVVDARPGQESTDTVDVIAIIDQPEGTGSSSDLRGMIGSFVEFTGVIVEDTDERASAPRMAAESYRIVETGERD